MSSNPTWVVIGLVTVAVGIGLVAWSRRRATSGT
jgi:LPXTG-motif cell wall-anchored protein